MKLVELLFTRLLLLLSVSLISVSARAGCVEGDPFAPAGLMPLGRFKGDCLKINFRRNYRIINSVDATKVMPVADAKAYAAEGKTFIANIAHDGDFWVATIPKKDIFESVSFQVEHFPPAEWLIAHTELRFNLNERITLYSQTRPGVKSSIKNFIVTVAAVQTVDGPDFDLLPAMQDYFALSKSIVSLNDKVATVVRDERNLVKQYPLKLDGEDLDRFWALLIERLHDPEFTELYHLFNRNCTNALFNVIDEFLGRERRRIDRIATTLPILSGSQLKRRKIVDLQKGMQTLNDEVNEVLRPSVCSKILRKFGLGPKEAR